MFYYLLLLLKFILIFWFTLNDSPCLIFFASIFDDVEIVIFHWLFLFWECLCHCEPSGVGISTELFVRIFSSYGCMLIVFVIHINYPFDLAHVHWAASTAASTTLHRRLLKSRFLRIKMPQLTFMAMLDCRVIEDCIWGVANQLWIIW